MLKLDIGEPTTNQEKFVAPNFKETPSHVFNFVNLKYADIR